MPCAGPSFSESLVSQRQAERTERLRLDLVLQATAAIARRGCTATSIWSFTGCVPWLVQWPAGRLRWCPERAAKAQAPSGPSAGRPLSAGRL